MTEDSGAPLPGPEPEPEPDPEPEPESEPGPEFGTEGGHVPYPEVVAESCNQKKLPSGSSGSSCDYTTSVVLILIPAFLFQVALSVQSQGQQATWEQASCARTKRKGTG